MRSTLDIGDLTPEERRKLDMPMEHEIDLEPESDSEDADWVGQIRAPAVSKLEQLYLTAMRLSVAAFITDESCMTVPARLAAARLLSPELWAKCPYAACLNTSAEIVKESGSYRVLCHCPDVYNDAKWEAMHGIRFGNLSGDACFKGNLLLIADRHRIPVSLTQERIPPLVPFSPEKAREARTT